MHINAAIKKKMRRWGAGVNLVLRMDLFFMDFKRFDMILIILTI